MKSPGDSYPKDSDLVQDRIVWADAMQTQRYIYAMLSRFNSHYLLLGKRESTPVI